MDASFSAVLRTPDKERIVIHATFAEHDPRRRGRMTGIYHEPIIETYTEVSFQGEVFDGGREPIAWGQVSGYLPESHPLRILWNRWHLNATRAHCAHQNRAVLWSEAPACAISGYVCGSAWLIEPLPDDVMHQIVALMTTTITAKRSSSPARRP